MRAMPVSSHTVASWVLFAAVLVEIALFFRSDDSDGSPSPQPTNQRPIEQTSRQTRSPPPVNRSYVFHWQPAPSNNALTSPRPGVSPLKPAQPLESQVLQSHNSSAGHPHWTVDTADQWPSLRQTYGEPQSPPLVTRPSPYAAQPRPRPSQIQPNVKIPVVVKDAVSPLAAGWREEARREYKRMIVLFAQSKTARLQGREDEAQILFTVAKEHRKTMKALDKTASELIFAAKNKDRDPCEIDLHGLFVKEAELKVKESIISCERRGDSVIRFIVGRGLHTDDGIPKVKPAVLKYIKDNNAIRGIPRGVHEDDRNPGVLVVTLGFGGVSRRSSTRRSTMELAANV
ncbi:hypothetical protein C8J57DRAFT_1267896 [Mycena rebaudengoi]|nr:hypothetical protein C8J57DRAFT_1267896 [Mycena rebaudengoi]